MTPWRQPVTAVANAVGEQAAVCASHTQPTCAPTFRDHARRALRAAQFPPAAEKILAARMDPSRGSERERGPPVAHSAAPGASPRKRASICRRPTGGGGRGAPAPQKVQGCCATARAGRRARVPIRCGCRPPAAPRGARGALLRTRERCGRWELHSASAAAGIGLARARHGSRRGRRTRPRFVRIAHRGGATSLYSGAGGFVDQDLGRHRRVT